MAQKKRKANGNHGFAFAFVFAFFVCVCVLFLMPRLELAGKVFNAKAFFGEQDNQVID